MFTDDNAATAARIRKFEVDRGLTTLYADFILVYGAPTTVPIIDEIKLVK
jgi:hypothetical protein